MQALVRMKFFACNKGKSSHFHNQTSFVSKSFKKATNHCAACLYLLGKFDAFTDRRESYTWKNVSQGGGGRVDVQKKRHKKACQCRVGSSKTNTALGMEFKYQIRRRTSMFSQKIPQGLMLLLQCFQFSKRKEEE